MQTVPFIGTALWRELIHGGWKFIQTPGLGFPDAEYTCSVRFPPALFKIRQACGDGVYFGQCTVTMVKFQGVCHGSLHKGLTTFFLMGEMAPFPLPFFLRNPLLREFLVTVMDTILYTVIWR